MRSSEMVTALPAPPFPAQWRRTRLGEIGEIVSGVTLWRKLASTNTRMVPYLRVANVKDGYLDLSDVKLTAATEEEITRNRLEPGDLLLTEGGDADKLVRGTYWNGEIGECIHQNHIFRIRVDPTRFSSRFLSAQIGSPAAKHYFLHHAKQTTGIATINRKVLDALPIFAPDVDEQCRIANRLAETLNEVNRARKAMRVQMDAIYDLRTSLIHRAYSRFPTGGRTLALRHLISLRKEIVHPRDNPTGKATFVGLEHIESGSGKRIGESKTDLSRLTGRKPRFIKGDIIYGYLRPYLNKVWLAEFDGICSVDQYVFTVDESQAIPEFIAWFMLSPQYLERAPVQTSPGQLPRIRTEEVASVELNLPSIPEQRRIVNALMDEMAQVERARAAVRVQVDAMDSLSESLLERAFGSEERWDA